MSAAYIYKRKRLCSEEGKGIEFGKKFEPKYIILYDEKLK